MTTDAIKHKWILEQNSLKTHLNTTNIIDENTLKYIGGVDISFVKGNNIDACASLVVIDAVTMKKVYERYKMINLKEPYIPGFLAFREVEFLVDLVEELRKNNPILVPNLIFVDGNGILHPRGFGLASHLGVRVSIPTIGIGKNLLIVDGLDRKIIKAEFRRKCHKKGEYIPLVGNSGGIWGAAFKSANNVTNPVYVSIGHGITLNQTVHLTNKYSKVRVPEPVRHADLGSRNYLKQYFYKVL